MRLVFYAPGSLRSYCKTIRRTDCANRQNVCLICPADGVIIPSPEILSKEDKNMINLEKMATANEVKRDQTFDKGQIFDFLTGEIDMATWHGKTVRRNQIGTVRKILFQYMLKYGETNQFLVDQYTREHSPLLETAIATNWLVSDDEPLLKEDLSDIEAHQVVCQLEVLSVLKTINNPLELYVLSEEALKKLALLLDLAYIRDLFPAHILEQIGLEGHQDYYYFDSDIAADQRYDALIVRFIYPVACLFSKAVRRISPEIQETIIRKNKKYWDMIADNIRTFIEKTPQRLIDHGDVKPLWHGPKVTDYYEVRNRDNFYHPEEVLKMTFADIWPLLAAKYPEATLRCKMLKVDAPARFDDTGERFYSDNDFELIGGTDRLGLLRPNDQATYEELLRTMWETRVRPAYEAMIRIWPLLQKKLQ